MVMTHSVTVARVTLTHLVKVQILVGQPSSAPGGGKNLSAPQGVEPWFTTCPPSEARKGFNEWRSAASEYVEPAEGRGGIILVGPGCLVDGGGLLVLGFGGGSGRKDAVGRGLRRGFGEER